MTGTFRDQAADILTTLIHQIRTTGTVQPPIRTALDQLEDAIPTRAAEYARGYTDGRHVTTVASATPTETEHE